MPFFGPLACLVAALGPYGGGGGEEGDLRGWVNNGRDFSQERNVLKRVLPRRGNKVGRERWLLLPSIGFGGREIASLAAALGPLACLAAAVGSLACPAAAIGPLAWLA